MRSDGEGYWVGNRQVLIPVLVILTTFVLITFTVVVLGRHRGTLPQTNPGRLSSETSHLIQSLEQPQSGTFLIAARGMRDPNFAQTVVLLIEYDGT